MSCRESNLPLELCVTPATFDIRPMDTRPSTFDLFKPEVYLKSFVTGSDFDYFRSILLLFRHVCVFSNVPAILMGRPSKMSIFEGTRNRPKSKDTGGDSPTLRGPSSEAGRGGCGLGRQTRPSKDGKNGIVSPSSMNANGNRGSLFLVYDRISTMKPSLVWGLNGGLSPLPEAGPEDGGEEEDTGGSGCSGDESGRHLLPVDYSSALPPQVVAPPCEWSDEDSSDFRFDSGFREASPVRLRPVKRELVDSPDEEEQGPPGETNKKMRYEGHAAPDGRCSLPQGQLRTLDTLSVARLQRPSTSRSSSSVNEDVTSSSKFLVDAFETGQQHPKAVSSMEVYYEDDVSDVCSSGRPIEGQIGSTRRRDFTGREFEDMCKTPDSGKHRKPEYLILRGLYSEYK